MVSTAPLFLVSSCLHGILIGSKTHPGDSWIASAELNLSSQHLLHFPWMMSMSESGRKQVEQVWIFVCKCECAKKHILIFFITQMNFYFKSHFFLGWHSQFFHLSPFPGVVSEYQEGLWGVWWGCTWSPFSLSSIHYGSCWEVPSHLASLSTQGVAEATSFPASLPLLWAKKPCWGHGGA